MNRNRKLTLLAMFAALSYIVMIVGRIPISTVDFLKYDPKDMVIVICGFTSGPLAALAVTVLVSVLEMLTVSTTGPIGLLMNILSTVSFACTASYIYKRNHTLSGAVCGLASGVVLMTLVMLAWNYLITPLYMGMPREALAEMLIPVFLPFNLLKGLINAAITLMVYKPISRAVRRFAPAGETQNHPKGRFNAWVTILSVVLLITCILVILAMKGLI